MLIINAKDIFYYTLILFYLKCILLLLLLLLLLLWYFLFFFLNFTKTKKYAPIEYGFVKYMGKINFKYFMLFIVFNLVSF